MSTDFIRGKIITVKMKKANKIRSKKQTKAYHILTINPGSMSTKISVFRDEKALFMENIIHKSSVLANLPKIADQFDLRLASVKKELEKQKLELEY